MPDRKDEKGLSFSMEGLLQKLVGEEATDLHISAGSPPMLRKDGSLRPAGREDLGPSQTLDLVHSIMNTREIKRFEAVKEIDFSFQVAGLGRFRANAFVQRGSASCAIRRIPDNIRTFEALGLPPVVHDLIRKPNGLILVTGPTGSGKSTTLASMVDQINSRREGHILTIEDPIEFVHRRKKCVISQREVYHDTESFASALKVALRQDPDVVFIGEMRDLETIQTALTIAETGHLTLTTLHTNSAPRTINRIIDVFPKEQKSIIRSQLSLVIEGIISQLLLPRVGGGLVLACEVLVATPAVRAMIREDKVFQIPGIMEIGGKYGMQCLNAELFRLVGERLITTETALGHSPDPEQLQKELKKAGLSAD
jgi:twitching motility protein PilT